MRIDLILFPKTNYHFVAIRDFAYSLRFTKLRGLATRAPSTNLVLGNGIS